MKQPNPTPEDDLPPRQRRRKRRTSTDPSADPGGPAGPVYGPVIGHQTIHGSQYNYFGPPPPSSRSARRKPRKQATTQSTPPNATPLPMPHTPPPPAATTLGAPVPTADALPALQRVLVRLGLLDPNVALPAPFETKVGESEGATTFFLRIPTRSEPDGELFAVKCLPATTDYQQHWASMQSDRAAQRHPAGLPLAGNEPADGLLVFRDGDWATRALHRLGLLATGESLPQPLRVLSGIAGFSRVYLFHVAKQVIIAKFDRPDRQDAEWASIRHLRRLGTLPAQFVLPFADNQPTDGVTVFSTFQGQTPSGDVRQLNELLLQRLLTNPAHADRAMALLQALLQRLYLGGQHTHDGRLWTSSHPELDGRSAQLVPQLQRLGLPLAPDAPTWDLSSFVAQRLEVPNPLTAIPSRLQQPAGKLFLSRTHGDLQSTNILVGLGEAGRPEDIALIDLEKFRDAAPVVDDLVRIEADFVRSVFSEIARSHFRPLPPERVLAASVQAIVLTLDALDGRPARITDPLPGVLDLSKAAGRWIHGFREWAWRLLTRPGSTSHWPTDWFHGLLFYYLKALLRPLVAQDPLRLRLVLLGAALAEQTLRDMDAGHYDGKLRFPDRWPARSNPTGPDAAPPPPESPTAPAPTPGLGAAKITTVHKGIAGDHIHIVGDVHIH